MLCVFFALMVFVVFLKSSGCSQSSLTAASCARFNPTCALITDPTSRKPNNNQNKIKKTCILLFSLQDFLKQIYDALSLSPALPLVSRFSGLTRHRARGGFLSQLIGRGVSITAAFPFTHPALLFSAPFTKITHCHHQWGERLCLGRGD